jgi:hypothetical protein
MRDFTVTALSYMTGEPSEALRQRPEAALARDLLDQLSHAPWLLALDGLERVLAAYHRPDAAQVADDEVQAEGDTGFAGREPRDCIRPQDDDLLRNLAGAAPSKVLVSSRLMPRALLNASDAPLPGVQRVLLHGLAPEDAEAMLRDVGIRGDGARMREHLKRAFDCHPLVVGFVAGLVRKALWARMNFDRWVEDRRGGESVNLADPDLRQRRTNILQLAFDTLTPEVRTLLARMGMISGAMELEVLEALNPARQGWLAPSPTRWLNATLADLEARGLLQWDRGAGTFDLHPVVRGYAIGVLDAQSRAEAGQRVADYFSARAEPDYDRVATVRELADRVQVVQAFCLAGQTRRAWDSLWPETRRALFRLEYHHETLALLRPLFPGGWLSPPSGVDDPGFVGNEAALALNAVGWRLEEEAQLVFSIRDGIRKGLSYDLSIRVRNHCLTARSRNEPALAARLLALSHDIAAALNFESLVLWCDVDRVGDAMYRGALDDARRLWAEMASRPAWRQRGGQVEAQCLLTEARLLFLENSLTAEWLHEAIVRVRELGRRSYERWLLALAGERHQSRGDDAAAVDAFAEAIGLARAVGLDDTQSEARRGLSLARLGRRQEAAAAAASASRKPYHDALAELHFELGDRDKARGHALAGYKWWWADGPPWCWHWHLETCRAVMRALGEPEPQLPPFDPARIKPIEYEADILHLLTERGSRPK